MTTGVGMYVPSERRIRKTYLQLTRPSLHEDVEREVIDTLRSGWLSTGPKVRRFEQALATTTSAPNVVALNSCTAALHLALIGAGIGPGDEVVVPTVTFPATVNGVLHVGATPVLADVEAGSLNLDHATLSGVFTTRTRAVIPVHMAGQPADLDAIVDVAAPRGIVVIDDAAHAIGAQLKDRPIGSVPGVLATCLSFHPTKIVTTGEGGALLTADVGLAERVRVLANHGLNKDSWSRRASPDEWDAPEVGFKYNLTDLAASIGIHQLRRLDVEITQRTALARRYHERLEGSRIRPLEVLAGRRHAWQLLVVVLPDGMDRAWLRRALHESNIGSGVHFNPIHTMPLFRLRCVVGQLPVGDALAARLVSLPLYGVMTVQDVDDVVDTLFRIVGQP